MFIIKLYSNNKLYIQKHFVHFYSAYFVGSTAGCIHATNISFLSECHVLTVNVTTRLANTGQLAKSGKQNIREQHFSVHLPQGPWTVPLERNPYKFTICDLFLAIGTLIKKVTYGNGFTTNWPIWQLIRLVERNVSASSIKYSNSKNNIKPLMKYITLIHKFMQELILYDFNMFHVSIRY